MARCACAARIDELIPEGSLRRHHAGDQWIVRARKAGNTGTQAQLSSVAEYRAVGAQRTSRDAAVGAAKALAAEVCAESGGTKVVTQVAALVDAGVADVARNAREAATD